jgi:hypothetical protein
METVHATGSSRGRYICPLLRYLTDNCLAAAREVPQFRVVASRSGIADRTRILRMVRAVEISEVGLLRRIEIPITVETLHA